MTSESSYSGSEQFGYTSSSSSTMELDDSSDSLSQTEFKVVKFSHTWIIKNFSFCTTKVGKCLKSPRFSADPNDQQQLKWRLELYSNGFGEESKNYVALFLHLLPNQTTTPVTAKFKSAILKANGEQTNVKGPDAEANNFGPVFFSWGYKQFIRRDFLFDQQNELLPDDRLSIFCEVSMVVDKVNATGCVQITLEPVPQSRLVNDMGQLLKNELLTDCVICSGDQQEFKVHKAVLACRSPVFSAMFTNDTEESRTSRVNIPDISAPVLGQLLHFLYTGCEPKLLAEQDMAQGLLAAADKYQLDRLKAICQNQLSMALNKDNVCAMLVLADRHNAGQLKKRAIQYINLHADEVTKSEGWPTFVSSHPELLKQLVKGLSVPHREL